jgi:hypothetical protein
MSNSGVWGIDQEYFDQVYGRKKMNIKKDMDKEIYKLACAAYQFSRKHHPQMEEWEDPVSYFYWYVSNGFMVTMSRSDGVIEALACGRPVNDPQDGNIPYKFCENGPCIFIDFLAIENRDPLVLPAFGMSLFQRFGQRKQIAYQRVSVHDYDHFLRNIGRINRIGEGLHEPA